VSRRAAFPAAAIAPAPRTASRAPIVLVTGGKGGVGKTLLASNLGIELARRGRRVLLADLDLGLANLDVSLRLAPRRNVEDALRGRCTFKECVVPGPHGVDLLPASSGTIAMARLEREERERLLRGLTELARDYEILLADGAAGIGPDVLAFAAAADHVLLVTTPDAAALTDAYGLLKALHVFGEETGREVATPELVVNQAGDLGEAERTLARLRAVCERFLARSPQSAGWLPAAIEIARSARTREPFALGGGESLAHGCLRQLASRLERLCAARRPGARSRISRT
jgi:flagellar biosynthesis protein FlhG